LVAAVLLYRVGFGLSWSTTVALLIVVIVGGAFYWRAFRYKLPATSRRARFLTRVGGAKLRAACTECGWRGEISALTRRSTGDGGIVLLCPSCGREVGHSLAHA
jgi:hypothetical protein